MFPFPLLPSSFSYLPSHSHAPTFLWMWLSSQTAFLADTEPAPHISGCGAITCNFVFENFTHDYFSYPTSPTPKPSLHSQINGLLKFMAFFICVYICYNYKCMYNIIHTYALLSPFSAACVYVYAFRVKLLRCWVTNLESLL